MGAFLLVRYVLYFAQVATAQLVPTHCASNPLPPHASPPPSPSLSAHNARFDFHFLNAEFARARWKGGLSPGVCTLALAKKVLGGAGGQQGGSYRLGDLVQVRVALEAVTLRVETKLLIA